MCDARFIIGNMAPMGCARKIPASEKIPKAAKLFKFPTAEKWGLIWAFNGAEAALRGSRFSRLRCRRLDFRAAEAFDLPVEPWVPFTNSMDFQHLRVLHGLKIDCNPDQIHVGRYKIEYDVRFEDPNLGMFDQSIRVTGTNTIALAGKLNGMNVLSMATGTPTPDGRTHGWSVTATPLSEGTTRSARNGSHRAGVFSSPDRGRHSHHEHHSISRGPAHRGRSRAGNVLPIREKISHRAARLALRLTVDHWARHRRNPAVDAGAADSV